jgi:hypothetical protein
VPEVRRRNPVGRWSTGKWQGACLSDGEPDLGKSTAEDSPTVMGDSGPSQRKGKPARWADGWSPE